MGKIYLPPAEIKVPDFNWENFDDYQKTENKFIDDLKQFCKQRNSGEYIGEVIKFPVADSYALYMVASLSPIELIHLPLMDAWEFQYIDRLTAQDIREKIDNEKKLAKFFGR
jgi:hypothetical protein